LRELIERFPYRLDTNFAKMDRIVHADIETFKTHVYETPFHGKTIGEWNRLLSRGTDEAIKQALAKRFNIRDKGQSVIE
jgi:hypothetical protein